MLRRALVTSLTALGVILGCVASPPPSPSKPAASAPVVEEPPDEPRRADAGATQAAASPPLSDGGAAPSREAELRWARARWPRELANVDTEPHDAELAAWLGNRAELVIWFTGDKYRCRRGLLSRGEGEDDLALRVYTTDKRVGGVRSRSYTEGSAGHVLWFGGGGGEEQQAPDGSWQTTGGWGVSDLPALGMLTRVDESVARYDGSRVEIKAACDGPTQRIACGDGGARECDTCQNVTLHVTELPWGMLGIGAIGKPPQLGGCVCPDANHPDIQRANALFEELDAWTTTRAPGAQLVAIYRSEAACRADRGKP